MRMEPLVIRAKSGAQVDGNPLYNSLLQDLPEGEARVLSPALVFIQLRAHDVLNDVGQPIKHAYFINTGLASVLNVMEDGKGVEVGLSGCEGFVGLPLIVGFQSSPNRVIIQVEGGGFRIGASALVEMLRECPSLERRLNRYGQVFALQSGHVAACNRLHQVEQRLARWLLMCQDRIGSDFIPLTQEFLAFMLGTGRSSVTVAAGILQKTGSIAYTPGHVTIIDRTALEDSACECYGAMIQQASKWEKESA